MHSGSLPGRFSGLLICLVFLFSVQIANGSDIRLSIEVLLEHQVPEANGQDWYYDTVTLEEQWLFDVYREFAFNPLWIEDARLNKKGKILFEKLLTAEEHGLNPPDYKLREIRRLLTSEGSKQLAMLDVLLTEGILRFVHDISEGRSQARRAFPQLFPEAGNVDFDAVSLIKNIRLTLRLDEYLATLGPHHSAYRVLQAALIKYRLISKNGGWLTIASGKAIRLGSTDLRVPAIQQLLVAVGDLSPASPIVNDVVNELTVEAVKRFQLRHGLDTDGIVGKRTLLAMNVSVDNRIEQIKLNLERWRWNDQSLGRKYVLVNIAGFDLKAVEDDQVILDMPVIVGKLNHESPIFSDRIRYAEFNPFWNLPPSIARTEFLRHLRDNPDYLASKHIRLFSSWQKNAVELDPLTVDWHKISSTVMNRYKLRQDPGEWNALGTMKFVFPNKYAVYLHDTPHHELFNTSNRAYSHGCIRLSDSVALAVFLMGGTANKWDRSRVGKIVDSNKRTVVRLPEQVPVHLTYLTSWYDGNGLLHFSRDIYQRDKKLQAALRNSGL